MNASPSSPARRVKRLGLPALVLLLATAGLTTAACGHTHYDRYGRVGYASYDYGYGDRYYSDITRSFYTLPNRRAQRRYVRRLDAHGRRFYRSLEDHHRRFHRRRGTIHRWGYGRSDACRSWEARWRPDRRDRYYDRRERRYDRRDRPYDQRDRRYDRRDRRYDRRDRRYDQRDRYYDRRDRRYDQRDRRYDQRDRRDRRLSYGSVTLEYYRHLGRSGGREFYLGLDVPLQRFYTSLDRHHDRYHRPYNTTHRWNGYDSGTCFDWERQWNDDRYTYDY